MLPLNNKEYYVDKLNTYISNSKEDLQTSSDNSHVIPTRMITPVEEHRQTKMLSSGSSNSSPISYKICPNKSSQRTDASCSNSTTKMNKNRQLQMDWQKMLNNPKLSDVTIIAQGGIKIYAHKLVFLVRCAAIIDDIDSSNMVDWSTVASIEVLAFLSYVYCSSLDDFFNLRGNVSGITLLSKRYLVNEILRIIYISSQNTDKSDEELSPNEHGETSAHRSISPIMFSDDEQTDNNVTETVNSNEGDKSAKPESSQGRHFKKAINPVTEVVTISSDSEDFPFQFTREESIADIIKLNVLREHRDMTFSQNVNMAELSNANQSCSPEPSTSMQFGSGVLNLKNDSVDNLSNPCGGYKEADFKIRQSSVISQKVHAPSTVTKPPVVTAPSKACVQSKLPAVSTTILPSKFRSTFREVSTVHVPSTSNIIPDIVDDSSNEPLSTKSSPESQSCILISSGTDDDFDSDRKVNITSHETHPSHNLDLNIKSESDNKVAKMDHSYTILDTKPSLDSQHCILISSGTDDDSGSDRKVNITSHETHPSHNLDSNIKSEFDKNVPKMDHIKSEIDKKVAKMDHSYKTHPSHNLDLNIKSESNKKVAKMDHIKSESDKKVAKMDHIKSESDKKVAKMDHIKSESDIKVTKMDHSYTVLGTNTVKTEEFSPTVDFGLDSQLICEQLTRWRDAKAKEYGIDAFPLPTTFKVAQRSPSVLADMINRTKGFKNRSPGSTPVNSNSDDVVGMSSTKQSKRSLPVSKELGSDEGGKGCSRTLPKLPTTQNTSEHNIHSHKLVEAALITNAMIFKGQKRKYANNSDDLKDNKEFIKSENDHSSSAYYFGESEYHSKVELASHICMVERQEAISMPLKLSDRVGTPVSSDVRTLSVPSTSYGQCRVYDADLVVDLTDVDDRLINLVDSRLKAKEEAERSRLANRPLPRSHTSKPAQMPNLSALTDKQYKEELQKFGLKMDLPRVLGAKVLKHIYNAIIPIADMFESQDITTNSCCDDDEQLISKKKFHKIKPGFTFCELQNFVRSWIIDHPQIHELILTYEPLWLDSLRDELKVLSGKPINEKHLMDILDEDSIVFRLTQAPYQRQRRRNQRHVTEKNSQKTALAETSNLDLS